MKKKLLLFLVAILGANMFALAPFSENVVIVKQVGAEEQIIHEIDNGVLYIDKNVLILFDINQKDELNAISIVNNGDKDIKLIFTDSYFVNLDEEGEEIQGTGYKINIKQEYIVITPNTKFKINFKDKIKITPESDNSKFINFLFKFEYENNKYYFSKKYLF